MSEVAPLDDDVRASSEAVLSELQLLRQRDGASERKLRDLCPTLLSLQVVSSEMTRSRYAESDRHLAAWSVLSCAISFLIHRAQVRQILSDTLNMRELHEGDLEDRRRLLQKVLFLTPKVYRRLEDDAYVKLASRLVAANTTPCGPDADTQRQEQIKLDFSITTDLELIRDLLEELGQQRFGSVRHVLEARLLQSFPRGAQAAAEELGADVPEFLHWRRILEATIRDDWPRSPGPASRASRRITPAPPNQSSLMPRYALAERMLYRDMFRDEVPRVSARAASSPVAVSEEEREAAGAAYRAGTRAAFDYLTTLLRQHEWAADWEALLRRTRRDDT